MISFFLASAFDPTGFPDSEMLVDDALQDQFLALGQHGVNSRSTAKALGRGSCHAGTDLQLYFCLRIADHPLVTLLRDAFREDAISVYFLDLA